MDFPSETLPSAPPSTFALRIADVVIVLAVVVPTLLAFNLPPSSTFFNQAAALVGWGAFVVSLTTITRWPAASLRRDLWVLLAPLAILAAAAAASIELNGLPSSLGLSAVGAILAAALAVVAGAAVRQSGSAHDVFRGFCIALVIAGLLGAVIGSIQIFMPDWAEGEWLAAAPSDGRASSNLRQPNHLSSLLVWSLVALAWLWQSRTLPEPVAVLLGLFFVFGIVLTGSRTGLLDFGLLTVWAALDRRLPRGLRLALGSTLLVYGLFWWGMAEWAQSTHGVFGGEARMGTQGDISSSRFRIWQNTLSLIQQHPWFGVGWGEFNFAWSLTPFPARPVAFFDHTHNIVLQFAVELGVPLALLLMALLVAGLWAVFRNSAGAEPARSMTRAAFMVVLTIGVHSLLEYPLWYAYFLLPTAFAFGFGLARDVPDREHGAPAAAASAGGSWLFAALGLVLVVGGAGAVADYHRVTAIFSSDEGTPLTDRIARGQHSIFFAYHADYAAVTTTPRPSERMSAFKQATQNLLDTRLMMAWAKAYAERGDLERAKHLAQRLREFRNEDSKEFFAPCTQDVSPRPYQCEKPGREMDYRDFK